MKKILIINNDCDLLSLLKTWFELKTYIVEISTGSLEALILAKSFNPDVIVADVVQIEAVTLLRSDDQTCKIPVLLMIGYSRRMKSNYACADDVIEKPFNLSHLEFKVQKLFSLPPRKC